MTDDRMGGLDVEAIRRDFPILERRFGGSIRSSTSTARPPRSKPNQVIDAEADFYRLHNANAHRGIYTLGEEATRGLRGCAGDGRTVPRRARTRDDRVHAGRHRVDEPRRARLGSHAPARGRRDPAHRDGAPFEHRAVADDRGRDRRDAALHPPHRRRAARPLRARLAAHRAHEDPQRHRHVERARHDHAAPTARRRRARGRARGRRRRRAARSPPRRSTSSRSTSTSWRSRGHKMLGPTASGGLYGQPRAPRGDGADARRRRDDPRGLPRPLARTSEPPYKFEAGTMHDRPAGRARGRDRLPRGARHGRRPRARGGDHAVRARPAARRRGDRLRPEGRRASAAAP